MAKVNVNSALKRDDIRKVLESQECPKYTFVKMLGPVEMQFDVEEDGTHGDAALGRCSVHESSQRRSGFHRSEYVMI